MLSQRVKSLNASPTLSLASKAKELSAEGNDVISLTVGEPDWNTFEHISSSGIQAIKNGQTKYTPASGLPDLRKAIAADYNDFFNTEYSFENVTVSAGAKFIIFSCLQSIIDPGDEVIIPAPYWVSYPDMVELAGGVPKVVSCNSDSSFKLSPKLLEGAITKKTKAIILNSPSNPTGMTYTEKELKSIGAILVKHPNIVIISDDIYNRLVLNGDKVAPHLLSSHPELIDRCVCINGASKAYSMTGWRVGWALGPKDIIAGMTKLQSQSVSCAPSFAQVACIDALKSSEDALAQSVKTLIQRRDKAVHKINNINGIEVIEPNGAFYLFVDLSPSIGKSFNGVKIKNSEDFCQKLLEEKMVVTVPGKFFGLENHMRLSYALSENRMSEGLDRIDNFISMLK